MSVYLKPIRVLILYYSYSGQSSVLVRRLASGLGDEGVVVHQERICPLHPLRFPLGSILKTVRLMLTTLFRRRHPIEPLEVADGEPWDLVILGGPTWSWNVSGPILSLLDSRPQLFRGRPVLALISCRGYWSSHWRYLRRRLERMGATPLGPLVFDHPQAEPWRTLGVFFKIAGIAPERSSSPLSHFYRHFGHTPEQFEAAQQLGRQLAAHLKAGPIPPDFKYTP
ncbi:flavodoxin family protein [Desulfurivibrio sp. D14AmB]|uniref:flavodoxin family protein n=1 Tax=Desulfurivibrio sp. D14AmB TaxID=3374370 RepID=UPI00376EE82F